MEMPRPNEPHIIGLRLPYLSRKNVGNKDPMKNMALMIPPSNKDIFRSRPTLICKTDVI